MPRSLHFDQDQGGRTPLMNVAANGTIKEAEAILFSLVGTGMSCERLALINRRDKDGKTAFDLAREAGNDDIAALLEGERYRMEFFE